MSTFLLIHGAWHGAWCWYKVVPRLEKLGHTVLAPDLPAMGRDRTAVNRVSLASWREFVCDIVDSVPEQVMLVGHSRGGIVISEVAEARPDRIRKLVYLTAFLLKDGQSLFDVASSDPESLVPPNMVMSDDKSSSTLRDDALRDAFYGECNDDDLALARLCLKPEPTVPLATPIRVTEPRYGSVPRAYIGCLRDRAMTPAMQRSLQAGSPCSEVLDLDADHSPFFSRPDELVRMLDSLAATPDRPTR
jgi:pimeloyl-ACP methyl ester carboxylesterase